MTIEARVAVSKKKKLVDPSDPGSDSVFRVISDERSNTCAKTYDVAIIGLGYVGLPLCLAFAKSGARVLGVDCDPEKSSRLSNGCSYIKHIPQQDVADDRQIFECGDRVPALTTP